jgi:hypothetical protein
MNSISWEAWPLFTPAASIKDVPQIHDGRARGILAAICDGSAAPCTVFRQGETAHFYFEFEVLKDIQVPIGGIVILDHLSRVIHGKNSLQFGLEAPPQVLPGSRLRFHQAIKLELSCGEYWITVGLVSTDPESYRQYCRGILTHVEMHGRIQEHCRIRLKELGKFSIQLPASGKLLHHGLVNLPSECQIALVPAPGLPGDPHDVPLLELGPRPDKETREICATPPQIEFPSPPKFHRGKNSSYPGCHLVYLSSFPRSGNSWVRNLVEHYFDRRVASLYPEPGETNLVEYSPDSYGEVFVTFQTQYEPIKNLRRLVHGCGPVFSLDLRSTLAGSEEHHFVKTHEMPYDNYLPGEGAIFIVRHPGAVFWSYFQFLKDIDPEQVNTLTLEKVIQGNIPQGSWSEHTTSWLDAASRLGERFQLIRFEELFNGENQFCRSVLKLCGLPWKGNIGFFPPFEHWHQVAPTIFRSGRQEEWREKVTPSQKALIWECHQTVMKRLGYQMD